MQASSRYSVAKLLTLKAQADRERAELSADHSAPDNPPLRTIMRIDPCLVSHDNLQRG
jgi:hypothetical protein